MGMRTSRSRIGSTVAVVAIALSGASYAWACSTQARLAAQGGQNTGPVGTRITINGTDTGQGPVEVRWDSKSGVQLAEVMGPNFSVNVTIPQANAGAHYIVAFQKVGTTTATMAFEVTPARQANADTTDATDTPNTTETSNSQTGGTTSGTANGTEAASSGSTTQTSATNTQSSSAQSSNTSSSTQSSNTQSSTDTGSNTADQSSSISGPAPAGTVEPATDQQRRSSSPAASSAAPAKAQPASANPPALTTPGGQVVFGGSQATVSQPEAGEAAVSAATASGDTWSGFAAGAKPSLLGDGLGASESSTSTGSVPALGVALLGSGLVALFAGFALAEMRRKRALASVSSH